MVREKVLENSEHEFGLTLSDHLRQLDQHYLQVSSPALRLPAMHEEDEYQHCAM